MANTLIIQSSRTPFPYIWLKSCLTSVKDWCELNQYEYQFLNDELFDFVPDDILKKTSTQRVIATDLARLLACKAALEKGYETVIWLDADFLIFDPVNFILPDESFALGRELWVQHDKQGKLKVYKKLHNAFLMFRQNNHFLDFYIETAERLLRKNSGTIPPQFIGPKLLTALHGISCFPVMETAGMLSPCVIRDILMGNGPALDLFVDRSTHSVTGANLCTSSCHRGEVLESEMERLIELLLRNNSIKFAS